MMKKTLIAAGVAVAMSVPAIAAADVSLTAQLQAELTSTSADDGSIEGLQMGDGMQNRGANVNSGNWSRIDLKASHDLGNGLSAFGHISNNINPSEINFATREMLVGLKGNFGALSFGRQTIATATNGKDPFNGTFMQARGNGGMTSSGEFAAGANISDGAYLDQAIGYAGTFGALTLKATVGLDPVREEGEHAYGVLAEVDLNPVTVWVGHSSADEFNGGADDVNMSKIGASFKTGAFGVMAQYETVEGSNRLTGGGTGDAEIDYMMVAGTYTMGANTFMLGYGIGDADDSADDKDWVALGMRHAFTRQVSMHGGVRMTNHADDDQEETVVGAGMRVVF